jgi:hypothetical protein
MRIRALSVIVLLSALATGIRADAMRLLRYDATYDNAMHSALCVVPPAGSGPGRAQVVCFYAIPGEPRRRDDTDGSGKPPRIVAPGTDVNFNVWLSKSLSGAARCTIGQTLTIPDLPSEEALKEVCRGATYEVYTVAGTAPTFITDVRQAVAATLPPAPAPAPAPAAVAASAEGATQTAPPLAKEEIITTPSPTETKPSAPITDKETIANGAAAVQHQNGRHGAKQDEDKNKAVVPAADWTQFGLLILIAVLAVALSLDRLAQVLRRRRFRKSTFAGDVDVQPASDFESAAVHFKEQRDIATRELAAAMKRREAAEADLERIGDLLKAGKGEDRDSRIATLIAAEKGLLKLAPSASIGLALKDLETRLKEHKSIVDLISAQRSDANALGYVRECLELVKAFEKPFFDGVDGPQSAQRVMKEITTAIHGLYTTVIAPDAGAKPVHVETAAIRQALSTLRAEAKERESVIVGHTRDLAAASAFLSEHWPDTVDTDLGAAISILSERMRDARSIAANVGCATDRGTDAIMTELATLVDRERSSSRQTQAILQRLRAYLDLPDRDATELNDIIASELGKPTRILRLALSATVPLLRSKLSMLADEEDASVLRMLRIGEIANELQAFLGRLWQCDSDRLWAAGIQPGFARNWLHQLFRAEAVLRTYFMASRLADLGEMLSVIVWAFRYASAVSGYEVDRVHLLAAPPSAMVSNHNSAREFRTCPDIRTRIQSVLRTEPDGGFAIDVDAVGVRGTNSIIESGAVVLAKRVDWED